jgi:hypothetical protein
LDIPDDLFTNALDHDAILRVLQHLDIFGNLVFGDEVFDLFVVDLQIAHSEQELAVRLRLDVVEAEADGLLDDAGLVASSGHGEGFAAGSLAVRENAAVIALHRSGGDLATSLRKDIFVRAIGIEEVIKAVARIIVAIGVKIGVVANLSICPRPGERRLRHRSDAHTHSNRICHRLLLRDSNEWMLQSPNL